METLEKLALEGAKEYIEGGDDDLGVNIIEKFLQGCIDKELFDDEISIIWNKEEDNAFDVFYCAHFGDRSFYVSVDYIEYLNSGIETDIDDIQDELIGIYERICSDIYYLKTFNARKNSLEEQIKTAKEITFSR